MHFFCQWNIKNKTTIKNCKSRSKRSCVTKRRCCWVMPKTFIALNYSGLSKCRSAQFQSLFMFWDRAVRIQIGWTLFYVTFWYYIFIKHQLSSYRLLRKQKISKEYQNTNVHFGNLDNFIIRSIHLKYNAMTH